MSAEECDFNSVDDEIYNLKSKISSQRDDLLRLADLIYCAIDQIIKDDDMTKFNLKIIQDDIAKYVRE